MTTTGAMYDDMRSEPDSNRQPEVPDLEKCTNCGLLFEESTMITDDTDNELFCGLECLAKYFTE